MTEHIGEVGYINEQMKHVLISIYDPVLLNPGSSFVQVAISIEGVITLRAELNEFLAKHGVRAN